MFDLSKLNGTLLVKFIVTMGVFQGVCDTFETDFNFQEFFIVNNIVFLYKFLIFSYFSTHSKFLQHIFLMKGNIEL